MIKRERVERAMACEPTDRVPVCDKLRNDAAIRHYAGRPLRIADGFETVCRATDHVIDLILNPMRFPRRTRRWIDEDGRERQDHRWTSWIVELPYPSMEDLVRAVETDLDRRRAWRPTRAHLEEYRQDFLHPFRHMSPDDPPVRAYDSPATLDIIHQLCGLQQFCYLQADHPDLVAGWLDARTEAAVAHAHAIAELGLSPVAAHAEDIACKGRTMYSPAVLRELVFPRLARIVRAWHEHGVKIMFHSDGYLMDVLDDVLTCGFDGLHPIETVAGMDLGEVRRRVGNRMFLCGGIDVSQLLPFGSVAEVRAECDRAARMAAPGYFIGSTTEMNATVPLRNVRAVYETPYRLAGLPPPPPGAG